MEPRAIANINGSIVPSPSPSKESTMSAIKEYMDFSSPVAADLQNLPTPLRNAITSTPTPRGSGADGPAGNDNDVDASSLWISPIKTPYFINGSSQSSTQQTEAPKTCPPKQQSIVFPDNGVIGRPRDGEEGNPQYAQRILLARRKSLQWMPKVGSPLAKSFK